MEWKKSVEVRLEIETSQKFIDIYNIRKEKKIFQRSFGSSINRLLKTYLFKIFWVNEYTLRVHEKILW